jgi:peptidyl-prolyl cis-trans isomerase SurA
MTRTLKFALLGVCALALSAPAVAAKQAPATPSSAKPSPGTEPLDTGETPEQAEIKGDGVAAIVNDTVITDYDLRQRVSLYIATSGKPQSPEAMKQIRDQILEQLENERIQLLEAQKNNISVSSADVDKAIDNILKDNHLTPEQLNQMLGRNGVHLATMRSQIAAQIAWSKTVQDQYGDRVNVSEADVTDEMQKLAEGKNKPHYLVSEIFMSVDNPEDDAKVRKSMDDLETQIRSGAQFPAVARQFSQNPTAAQGGDLGVVVDGQLPKELNDALGTMHAGSVSPPIKSTGGYYILALRARQEGEGTKVPDPATQVNAHPDSLPLARLLLPLGPKPPKEFLEKAANFAMTLRNSIQSCDQLPEVQKQVKGIVYQSLGTMRLADLSPEIQHALQQTQPGETAPPFQSAAGIELIVRCDKAIPKVSVFSMPSRDDVEQQLFEQRIAVLSRQYLRDLKRDADIEAPGEIFGKSHKVDATK